MLKRQGHTDSQQIQASSDEELLAALQEGEGDTALSLLVQRHGNRFYSLAYRIVNKPDEAEDIVQNAFIKLWQDPFKFSTGHGTKFTTWFYRIIVNMALDSKRRDKRGFQPIEAGMIETLADDSITAERQREEIDTSATLIKAMKQLPLRQQVALELHYFDGLPQKDAAFVMQLSEKAYQSLLHRGKLKLKDTLPSDILVGTSR